MAYVKRAAGRDEEEQARSGIGRMSEAAASLIDRLPPKLGAIVKRIVEFVEPDPQVLTEPTPAGAAGAFVFSKGKKLLAGPLYHGTSSKLIERIEKEGLRPWQEIKGEVPTIWAASAQPRWRAVYFTRDPLKAAFYAKMATSNPVRGGSPVVLRVDVLPAEKFVADEDIIGKARDFAVKFPGAERPRGWRASFSLPASVLQEIYRRAGLGDTEEALKRLVSGTPKEPRFRGLGTVAYKGSVPPGELDVVGDVVKEADEIRDALAEFIKESKRQAQTGIPWWLK